MGEAKNNQRLAAETELNGNCGNCPHYNAMNQECRAKPPTGFPVQVGPTDFKVHSFWPPARSHQWCGEHPLRKAKADLPVLALG